MSEDQEITLTLNLKSAKYAPRYRRTERMISTIRNEVARKIRSDSSEVKLSEKLNNFVWSHGGRNYISRITVITKKDEDGFITVRLPNEVEKENKPTGSEEKRAKEVESSLNETPTEQMEPSKTSGSIISSDKTLKDQETDKQKQNAAEVETDSNKEAEKGKRIKRHKTSV